MVEIRAAMALSPHAGLEGDAPGFPSILHPESGADMWQRYWQTWLLIATGSLWFWLSGICNSAIATNGEETPDAAKTTVSRVPAESAAVVSLSTARDRARVMHRIYSSTLDVLHDHYFHVNKAVLPARAMEDIFTDIEVKSGTKTRWIAVNAKAMSVDHEPADDFEKEAARRIAAGEKEVEQTGPDVYRYAGAIPLQENCIQCHMGTLTNPPKKPRFAGLVISIPVRAD